MSSTEAAFRKFVEEYELDVPREKIENEKNYIILDLKHRMQYDTLTGGRLHLNRERELAEQADEIERAAVFEVKSELVLKSIIEKEGFSATKEELEAAAREFAERENTSLELVKRFFGEDFSGLEKSVKERKAKEWIFDQMN